MPDVSLVDFAFSFASKAEADLTDSGVHPSGASVVCEWLAELRDAAVRGDAAEVSRLVALVNEKIAHEIAWHRRCLRSARPDADALMDSEEERLLASLQRGASAQVSTMLLEVIP